MRQPGVYVLDFDNGMYKIGMSADVSRRCTQQGKSPLIVIECDTPIRARMLETKIHKQLTSKNKSIAGEIFRLDGTDLSELRHTPPCRYGDPLPVAREEIAAAS